MAFARQPQLRRLAAWVRAAGLAAVLVLTVGPSWRTLAAPAYPTRPIDFIVSFGPGGAADVTGRLIAQYASEKLGQPINVINVPGGAGVTGTLRALSAAPDGYTLLVDNHAVSSLMAVTQSQLPFDWTRRTWIARVTVDPLFYVVRADSPFRSLADVVAAARRNPKAFRWGSCGPSCVGTFGIAQLFYVHGLEIRETNMLVYRSGAETLTGLAGGNIDLAAQQLSEITPLVAAGRIRPLAVVWSERLPQYRDVPTVRELGLNLDVTGWQGLSGPPGLPEHVVRRWQEVLSQAVRDPAFLQQAERISKVVAYLPGDEMRRAAMAERDRYKPLAEAMDLGR